MEKAKEIFIQLFNKIREIDEQEKRNTIEDITSVIISIICIFISFCFIYDTGIIWGVIIITIPFYTLVWAYSSRYIGLKKGYTNCYWFGFWLGFIGFIIVCVLPPEESENNKGTVNKTKIINDYELPKALKPTNRVSELKEYKELLDSGIITKEEFEAKKKQLLGL